MASGLTPDELHVVLDVIGYFREHGDGAAPWDGYTTDPDDDRKASAAGWQALLDSAEVRLHDQLSSH